MIIIDINTQIKLIIIIDLLIMNDSYNNDKSELY